MIILFIHNIYLYFIYYPDCNSIISIKYLFCNSLLKCILYSAEYNIFL